MSTLEALITFQRDRFTLSVELALELDGVLGVFGPSGSGKTTLLRCLAGLEHPRPGRIVIGETAWQDEASRVFLPPHRRGIGFVSQEPHLFVHRSVRGNLEYGWKRRGGDRDGFDRVSDLLVLGPLMDRDVRQLSGGERRRVAIGRALVAQPGLLFLDEPTANLDLHTRSELLRYLDVVHDELATPILLVSHSLDDIARLADDVLLLENGRATAYGCLEEILTRLDLAPAQDVGAEAVIDAEVHDHDPEYHLTRLTFPGGDVWVPLEPLSEGTRVRVRIAARDVSLVLGHPTGTSILNVLPATVMELADAGPAQMLVRLESGGIPLLARVTRKSADALHLAPGQQLFAQVKSVALAK